MNATEEPIITISGSYVRHESSDTPVDKFCRLVADNSISGLRAEPIPDNVRWICEQGRHAVYIVELKPELRQVWWSDNEDDTADAALYNIATPYVIMQAAFIGRELIQPAEVFYRNQPLRGLDDELYLCNLRNVSEHASWSGYMCTSGLRYGTQCNREEILSAVVNHLWTGLFSQSLGWRSDNFWHYRKFGKDQRVKTIQRWQKESLKDPEFVLGVEWLPAKRTVRQLIEFHFESQLSGLAPKAAAQLGNLIRKAG